MTIDAELAALRVEQAVGVAPADLLAMPLPEARAASIARWTPWNAECPPVAERRPISLDRVAGLALDGLWISPGATRCGTIVFLHGGGWTFGSSATHLDLTCRLALAANAAVLSVDYRLSPEHPYPAPLDDALTAIAAMIAAGERVAVAGDSAGASLALAAMIARRDRGAPLPVAAALFYGCFAPDFTTESYRVFGDGAYGLPRARMEMFWRHYLGHAPSGPEGLATPGWSDVTEMPPMFVHAAGLDVLRDDSKALAARLDAAGVTCMLDIESGAVHGYLQMAARLRIARDAITRAGAFLRVRLDPQAAASKRNPT